MNQKLSKFPRFSVVIPCYNEENFISERLDSIRSQTYRGDVEVIVVDNNCTDNTAAIARSMGAKVVAEKHPGVCWARQAGTKAAQGEIIVSTDADTTNHKSWLADINRQFSSDPNIVGVAGACSYTDPWWGKLYSSFLFSIVGFVYRATGRTFYITAANTAFKKSAWTGYDTNMTQGGDEFALLKSLQKHGKVAFNGSNPAKTSGRRLQKGAIHSLFVSLIYFYLLAYLVNKLAGREIIKSAPAYRQQKKAKVNYAFRLTGLAIILVCLTVPFLRHGTFATIAKLEDIAASIVPGSVFER